MGDWRWQTFFSANYVNFQGFGVSCIVLFLLLEGVGLIAFDAGYAAMGAASRSSIFLACFALYWWLDGRYGKLPDRLWEGAKERRSARLVVGKRRRATAWAVLLVVASSAALVGLGVDRWDGATALIAAAWLALHRLRAGSLWGHYATAGRCLAALGSLTVAFPGLFGASSAMPTVPLPNASLTMILCVGFLLAVCGASEGRLFARCDPDTNPR